MSSVLWIVGAVVVCAALLYAAHVMEPHWVARDGTRFLTTSEVVDRTGRPLGRRHEVRGTIMGDGTVMLGKRSIVRTQTSRFRVRSKSPQVSRGRQQYVLEPIPPDPDGELTILRVPQTSRLSTTFDDLARAPDDTPDDAPDG